MNAGAGGRKGGGPAGVRLTGGIAHRCFGGHPWIYANEIAGVRGEPAAGETVWVRDGRGGFVGSGLYNPGSEIRIRLFSSDRESFDLAFIERRLRRAVERRGGAEVCRLVWSEGDGLPGFVVDRYGGVAVMQSLTAAADAHFDEFLQAVQHVVGPTAIIERSDAPGRSHEGLESRVGVVMGEYRGPSRHRVGDALFELDLFGGQKTGAYLDQVANYRAVVAHARGRHVLDCFAHTGGFGVHCAMAGAASVDAVEANEAAVASGRRNAELNGAEVRWHLQNAFDWLRLAERERRKFGLIVLDPPSFTRSRARVEDALRGYREIHVRAFGMVEPGGVLATFCCSHHVDAALFEDVVRAAAGDAGRRARLMERRGQGADHPVLLGMPETEYLKGLILEVE
ncbi:MAG TPA: class I SAM-dependent rRNA methyltransferase [Verrucomicrobiae bacterium]|nr:class I SAM-dependent rRNA methyltransferase [Verrucomicrobiae bacterium]